MDLRNAQFQVCRHCGVVRLTYEAAHQPCPEGAHEWVDAEEVTA